MLTSGSSAHVFHGKIMGYSYGENDLVAVKSCSTAVDAHVFMGLLRDNGVEASLADEANVSWYPGATSAYGGVRVMVRGGDAERALEILASPLEQDADHGIDVEPRGFDVQGPGGGPGGGGRGGGPGLLFMQAPGRGSTEAEKNEEGGRCISREEE
ncbi:MAG: DUF2007 domain-containing protein [Ignavibacteria bacterium]|nr:DUF2007 domain-containing protein [Ignavibacteria bacterium]